MTVTAPLLADGRTWEEMPADTTFRTASRTVTEADLVGFIGVCGFTEALFLDARHAATASYRGRLVPGALTYCLAEGLLMQTNVLLHTGLAFLGMELSVLAPVYVGDTITVVVTILESRPSQKPGRGVVTSENWVVNQHGEKVLRYVPVRLILGRDGKAET